MRDIHMITVAVNGKNGVKPHTAKNGMNLIYLSFFQTVKKLNKEFNTWEGDYITNYQATVFESQKGIFNVAQGLQPYDKVIIQYQSQTIKTNEYEGKTYSNIELKNVIGLVVIPKKTSSKNDDDVRGDEYGASMNNTNEIEDGDSVPW